MLRREKMWLWLDQNSNNHENHDLLRSLHILQIKIHSFDQFQQFETKIKELVDHSAHSQSKVSVICSSSLESEIYTQLVDRPQIDEIIIYCYKIQNGLKLKHQYQKIQRVINSDYKLINLLYSDIQ